MKPANCKIQRISKTYYWIAWAVWNALSVGAILLIGMEYPNYDSHRMNLLLALTIGIHLIYLFLLTKKRFHDTGKSTGYCALCILLIPILIGEILIFQTCLQDSDTDNAWGLNPEKVKYEKNRAYYGR